MAVKTIETTGHESQDAISHTTAGSLTAAHIAAVLYDDTASPAEILAALKNCEAKLISVLATI